MRDSSNYLTNSDLIVKKLAIKILDGLTSMILNYSFLYSDEEIKNIKYYISKLSNPTIQLVKEVESNLKPYAFKTWQYESENGNEYIHWLKNDKINLSNPVISATFGNVDSFCNAVIGVKYKVNIDAFIGACEKDAATVIEDKSKKSIYTIMDLDNEKVVNSYNLATSIITPKQTINAEDNTYLSKHNEVLLDRRYAIADKIICIDEKYNDLAKSISLEYDIPFDNSKSM